MDFSNQYLTYTEYQGLGGNLAKMPFNLLEFKARKLIDQLTFGRLINEENQIQEVKICVYELINEMQNFDNISNTEGNKGNIASESVGSYSVTYSNLTGDQKITLNDTQNVKYNSIIRTYLSNVIVNGVPALYRGV